MGFESRATECVFKSDPVLGQESENFICTKQSKPLFVVVELLMNEDGSQRLMNGNEWPRGRTAIYLIIYG